MDMQKYQMRQIQPGPCPPEGCPPFDRIDCIVVDKVYDSCFRSESINRVTSITIGDAAEWPTGDFAVATPVPCVLRAGETVDCNITNMVPAGDGYFTISMLITIPVTLTNPNAAGETVDRDFNFTRTVTLCAPEGVEIDCSESTFTQCNCVITAVTETSVEVTCDFQICMVTRSLLTVQLLVPSYGFCVPGPCETLPGVCPPIPPEQCF